MSLLHLLLLSLLLLLLPLLLPFHFSIARIADASHKRRLSTAIASAASASSRELDFLTRATAVRGVSFVAQTRQNLKLASWPEAVCGARSCLLEFANHVASTLLRLRNNSASRRDMYLGASRASMLKSCGVGMRPMTVWVATSESSGFPPMTVWVSPSRSTTAPRIGLNLIGKGDANSGGIGEL